MKYSKDILPDRLKTLVGNEIGKMKRSVFIEALGVGADTVSAWMKGKAYPRTEQLLSICNCLGCDIGYLIDEEQETIRKEYSDAHNITGLSEEAINTLYHLNEMRKIYTSKPEQLAFGYYKFFDYVGFIDEIIRKEDQLLPLLATKSIYANREAQLQNEEFYKGIIRAYNDSQKISTRFLPADGRYRESVRSFSDALKEEGFMEAIKETLIKKYFVDEAVAVSEAERISKEYFDALYFKKQYDFSINNILIDIVEAECEKYTSKKNEVRFKKVFNRKKIKRF